jgi:hypothetical protein
MPASLFRRRPSCVPRPVEIVPAERSSLFAGWGFKLELTMHIWEKANPQEKHLEPNAQAVQLKMCKAPHARRNARAGLCGTRSVEGQAINVTGFDPVGRPPGACFT